MRTYELVYVMRPDLTDQDVGIIQADVRNKIAALNGVIEKEDLWGKRRLAFEIKDNTEGVYSFVRVKLPADSPGKLKEQLRIDERIIRYFVTLAIEKKVEVKKD